MKLLNYSNSYLFQNIATYQELIDSFPLILDEIQVDNIFNERMPFGKYKGTKFLYLISINADYFNYVKQNMLNKLIPQSSSVYNREIKMIKSMIYAERHYKIERYGEEYEKRRKQCYSTTK